MTQVQMQEKDFVSEKEVLRCATVSVCVVYTLYTLALVWAYSWWNKQTWWHSCCSLMPSAKKLSKQAQNLPMDLNSEWDRRLEKKKM